jgi:hypothetical protein
MAKNWLPVPTRRPILTSVSAARTGSSGPRRHSIRFRSTPMLLVDTAASSPPSWPRDAKPAVSETSTYSSRQLRLPPAFRSTHRSGDDFQALDDLVEVIVL